MKITDFALIFIAIMLPFMMVLYINITFTIKAEEMELYYQNIIEAAVEDAAFEMKQIESEDKSIDYGYSGKENKKINVNAQVGVDSFFESMYETLGVRGNEVAESYFSLFVPAVAVIEYDGVRISQNETITAEDGTSSVQRVLRPKRYFTYTYSIVRNGMEYSLVPGGTTGEAISTHTVEFTLDEMIVHRGYDYVYNEEIVSEAFYVDDPNNNDNLVAGVATAEGKNQLKSEIISHLLDMKDSIIANVVASELSYSINANNFYAKQAGVTYSFSFPDTTEEDLYGMIDGVGMVAFVQGISVGNKYLNTKAYGMSTLNQATRYYFTAPGENSLVNMNLYHKDIQCPEYKYSKIDDMSPRYAYSRQEAATAVTTGTLNSEKQIFTGFYPCPICNP
ncbi:MAG: hypothetical protein J6A15_04945 [Clostridia bacterium]|nr:hypothetical protein [Clostridia bacterium]